MTISFTSCSSKRDGVGGGGKRQTNRETERERERETERGRETGRERGGEKRDSALSEREGKS